MYSNTLSTAALLGLATVGSSMPHQRDQSSSDSNAPPAAQWGGSDSVFKFPLANGFPNIANPSDQLNQIQQDARGTLPKAAPNAPAPATPQPDSLTSLGFIAFNELFEVAFFTELFNNVTTGASGFREGDLLGQDKAKILSILKIVIAQEELHELNANGAFQKFTGQMIQPCQYNFPVSNFNQSISLASTFTDVVLGTLPDIQTLFANANDNALIRGVGSVIGQEGEQNGFYRDILGKNPSALPFLTASARDFAFSAIVQNFVVPGSCSSSLDVLQRGGLTIFDILTVVNPPTTPMNQKVMFRLKTFSQKMEFSGEAAADFVSSHENFTSPPQQQDNLFLTYINQLNAPISVPIEDAKKINDNHNNDNDYHSSSSTIQFSANFPGADNLMNGLTIAAVTKGKDFVDVGAVANNTLFGPGLIEIN